MRDSLANGDLVRHRITGQVMRVGGLDAFTVTDEDGRRVKLCYWVDAGGVRRSGMIFVDNLERVESWEGETDD